MVLEAGETRSPMKRSRRRGKSAEKSVSNPIHLSEHHVSVTEKRRQEEGPKRIGRKRKNKGTELSRKLPQINPNTKCLLRLKRYERIKDYLLMEEEFIKNQELQKPQDESREEELKQILSTRGLPMEVGSLEEIIDDDHAIVQYHSTDYYVPILSIVDKD